jgi:hypothetical protein
MLMLSCNAIVGIDEGKPLEPGSRSDASSSGGSGAPAGGAVGAGSAVQGGSSNGSSDSGPRPCSDAASCGSGSYCSPGGLCEPCSDITSLDDLSQLEFSEPEPLVVLNDAAGEVSLRHPRAFDGTSKLLFQRDYVDVSRLWLTPDMTQSVGAPLPVPIDDQQASEGAPLKGDATSGVLSPFNFFFTRRVATDSSVLVELFGATVDASGYAASTTRLPSPFNTAASSERASRNLVVSQTRAFWEIDNGGLNIQLLTAPLDGDPVPALISIESAPGCVLLDLTYSPWVTPDGRLLFFIAAERDENCQRLTTFPGDIWIVKLDAFGQPVGFALPLPTISAPGTSEIDPSLSQDHCWLYFAGNSQEGSPLRLYRARRLR